ncbi:MAG: hypothetical protein HGA54_06510, partial [Actinobacteria bacterium]|nr:hypothetical protein [Actinomycetota bacterium]
MAKKVMIETASSEEMASAAVKSETSLAELVEAVSGDNRRLRQKCAGGLALISHTNPELLVPYSHELADALYRPEAQTRWEVLEALTNIVPLDARATDKAVAGAETSLYDEDSGTARLAAFRFLTAYGETTENRAERVWPLIDEAIQCYHGDPEFQDMLTSVLSFAKGKASKKVK